MDTVVLYGKSLLLDSLQVGLQQHHVQVIRLPHHLSNVAHQLHIIQPRVLIFDLATNPFIDVPFADYYQIVAQIPLSIALNTDRQTARILQSQVCSLHNMQDLITVITSFAN